ALVPKAFDSAQVVVEAVILVERQGLRHHRPRQLGPEVVQRRIAQRDQRAQAVVATRELDHDQDVVVRHPVLLRGVDGSRKSVWNRRVSRGEAGGAGAEHEARAQKVAALELVDADLIAVHLRCTYLSWNSGEARVMNQRVRSSGSWFRRVVFCGLSTPSSCVFAASAAEGSEPLAWPTALVTKL